MKLYSPELEACYASLEAKIKASGLSIDQGRIRAAYEVAVEAHDGQRRRAGPPYVTHTIAAAEIVAELGLDEDSIVAALLHDTLEDTSLSYEDIVRQFGPSVADIVDGVTKLTRVSFTSREEEQMENMRKMLLAMSKDIRVILIKLADRLHNMRTMEYMNPEKQRLKSLETMQVYGPIAHRLGIQRIKWELEDLSLQYLDPIGYKAIMESVNSRLHVLEPFMENIEGKIGERMREWGIEHTISKRLKHVYSIYRKMYTQQLDLSEIFDLCAFRVTVENLSDCYNVLGQIHDMFKPIPGRFKDYISTPKPNGYQSLHTTVIGSEGIPFEVQIRTWEMHRTAEYGVAAHWKYKSGESGLRDGDEEKFAWVRRLLESQQTNADANDFFANLKVDMFSDEVFVFSPKGDVINLPAGATPIDFAYNIHSAIGNSMVGAKVNGRIVPFDHNLQNGDIVEILTSKAASGPNRDWLKIAKSGSARTKIKQWFRKERRDENIVEGKELFDAEMRRAGITMAEVNEYELMPIILQRLSLQSVEDVYAAIGYGGITATKTVNRLRDELLRSQKALAAKTPLDKLNDAAERREQRKKPARAIQGVLVEGLDNCLIKFARCCTPVPGDEIVGFITRGYGVSVHRTDCANHISGRLDPDGGGRWIDVSWAADINESYSTTLKISASDRNGLIMDIATALASLSAHVTSLTAREVGNGQSLTSVTLEVHNLLDLQSIMNRLRAVHGVTDISRSNG